jgi:hypothetical protein
MTRELLESLEQENAGAQTSIDQFRREGQTRTGRYVTGRTVAASIALFALVLVAYWYQFTAGGAEFRAGYDKGHRDGTARWAETPAAPSDAAGRGGP